MTRSNKKVLSIVLSFFLIFSCIPVVDVYADNQIEIFSSGVQVTEKIYITEYGNKQLSALVPVKNEDGTVSGTQVDMSDGRYVVWASNLPLLAGVDETGKVTAYDFSKKAVIQLWIDENIKTLPLIGESTANAIWSALDSSGIDLDNADTDTIVRIVSAITGEQLGESLRTYLDNMNVVITATLYNAQGSVLGKDSIEVVVEKSSIASVAPTGVHITNKKNVPTTVAVGSVVQLYGACTPVRLNQGVKWSVGKNALDTSGSQYAEVSSDGLVTFLSPGEVTVRVNPQSALYATFSDTITFTVLDQSELPLESFDVTGPTSVAEGETIQLSVDNVVPAGAYKGDLAWQSSDESVAIVDENGVVTGLNGGSGLTYSQIVTITATMGGISRSFELKVTRPISASLTSVIVEGDTVLGLGSTGTYTSRITPERLNTSASVERQWGVYDHNRNEVIYANEGTPATNGIVTVDSQGRVTAISNGVSKIYAKATYGSSSAEGYLEVTCGKAITDFEIQGTSSIEEGDSIVLFIKVLAPVDYESSLLNTIKWSVEDSSVASVTGNGNVLGRDAGGRNSSRTTTVYATISGVTRSFTITVTRGWLNLSKYTDGEVVGDDFVIRDIPHKFTMKTYPESLAQSAVYWALETNTGSAPWQVSSTYMGENRNTENDYALVSDGGVVTGKKVGRTTLYGFSRYLLQSYVERTKEIEIIEILPESITLKAPDKVEYLEGETELDLTGMEVYLNYNKESLKPYYSDWESYTDDMLKCQVADYSVSKLNPNIIDATQYIIVSVERAGKTLNAVFAVTLNSKKVDTITVTPPVKTSFLEGEEIDFPGLKVVANYLNAESEEITDYEIDESSFSKEIFNVEQSVRVVYEHAQRSAEATFPIIIYGKPVIDVQVNGVLGEWTSEDIVFNLDSTNKLDGVTYFWRDSSNNRWRQISGDTHTISSNYDGTIYLKARNSMGYESEQSEAFVIKVDKKVPVFSLKQSVTGVTNEDYIVSINSVSYGKSGLKSVTVNGEEIGAEARSFVVERNGIYTVCVTANNGLFSESSVEINNIDKEAPGITDVTIIQMPSDSPERHLEGEFGNYYSADLVADVTAADSGVAGIDYVKYRLVGTDYTPETDWIIISDDVKAECKYNFKGYFEFVAVDKAGNESSSYYSDGFFRDSVKPVITTLSAVCGENSDEYSFGSWAADIVYFTPKSDSFSGVYEYYYSINGGEWVKLTADTLRARDDGAYVYAFKAISYSGLESDAYEVSVNIDRTIPTVRVEAEGTFGQWTKDDVIFNLSTLIECPSGCTYYYNDGSGWYELKGSTLFLSESINAYYKFKAVNGAGLESATSDSYRVMIDNVEPAGYIIPGVTEKTDSPYDIAIVPVAGESGYMKIYFNGEDVTESLKATVSKNGSYALTIIGNNMLSSTIMVDITNFSAIPTALFSYERADESSVVITSYNGSAANVTIPMEIDGFEAVSISENAFLNKNSVVSVTVPNTVTSIGENCFEGCEKLERVIIPDSVTNIANNAFDGCKNVTIYCYKGSFAQSYAQSNEIPYVLLDLVPVGKTVINEQAGAIFTYESLKTTVDEIVKADSSYTVMAIPSLMSASENYYGTGSVLYFFRNGTLAYTYNLVVYGDVTGDSVADVIDATTAQLVSANKNEIEEKYILAADFANDGAVDASDYQQVVNLSIR